MWSINPNGYNPVLDELFGGDRFVIYNLLQAGYEVEVMNFSVSKNNLFNLYRYKPDPSTPKCVYKKEFLAAFDDVEEFVSIARLIVASNI